MVLRQVFGTATEASIASYNWTDIASGTGYVTFYGSKGDNGELILTTSAIYSENIASFIYNQAITSTFVEYFDLDFDVTFNLPRNIKGDLIANIPMGIAATEAGPLDFEMYVIVKVYHVGTGGETLLGTGTSITSDLWSLATGGSRYRARTHALKANIPKVTHFKKGETLRMSVGGWFRRKAAGPNDAHIILAHDPEGRVFSNLTPEEPIVSDADAAELSLGNDPVGGGTMIPLTTVMQFHVPFVVDL